MLLFHQRTRKSLCRLGFVALCLVPTCGIAFWAAARNGEPHLAACAAQLGRHLRLNVSLGGVEYPEPCAARYTDFLLIDPQSDAPIAQAATVDVRTTGRSIAIVAASLTIESNGPRALAELLHDRLRDHTKTGELYFHLSIGELIVASPSGDVSLLGFHGRFEPTQEGPGARLTFRIAGMPPNTEPVTLTLVRYREGKTGFEFDTWGAFEDPAGGFGPVVQLLRTLVTNHQTIVPVTPEAEALMRAPINLHPQTPNE